MRKRMPALGLCLSFCLALAGPVAATTWFPKKVICPLCGTENLFCVIGSYGSYIYGWESKFQYVYWPRTALHALYACGKCGLTCFLWDFEKIPKEKVEPLRKVLEGSALPPPDAEQMKKLGLKEGQDPTYHLIPIAARLAAAEKVYTVLGLSDEQWCAFHRTAGYHYALAGMEKEAEPARRKALALADKLIAQKENAGKLKELYLISGAMRHFLKDDQGAVTDFRKGLAVPFEDPDLKAEETRNVDKYLTGLLNEYIGKIMKPAPKEETRKDGPP